MGKNSIHEKIRQKFNKAAIPTKLSYSSVLREQVRCTSYCCVSSIGQNNNGPNTDVLPMWCPDHSRIKSPDSIFDSKVQEHSFFYLAESVSKILGKKSHFENLVWIYAVWIPWNISYLSSIYFRKKHVFVKKVESSSVDEKVLKVYCIMSL